MKGMEYFRLYCNFLDADNPINQMTKELGHNSENIYLRLLDRIHSKKGYFCYLPNHNDFKIFMEEYNFNDLTLHDWKSRGYKNSYDYAMEVFKFLFRRNVFNFEKFKAYGILTSFSIQMLWWKAMERREHIYELIVEDYLVDSFKLTVQNKLKNVCNFDETKLNKNNNKEIISNRQTKPIKQLSFSQSVDLIDFSKNRDEMFINFVNKFNKNNLFSNQNNDWLTVAEKLITTFCYLNRVGKPLRIKREDVQPEEIVNLISKVDSKEFHELVLIIREQQEKHEILSMPHYILSVMRIRKTQNITPKKQYGFVKYEEPKKPSVFRKPQDEFSIKDLNSLYSTIDEIDI